jgi:hypothetical protein
MDELNLDPGAFSGLFLPIAMCLAGSRSDRMRGGNMQIIFSRLSRWVGCLAALIVFAGWWTVGSSLAAGEGWILHQRSDYLGQQTLYLSPQGMKVTSRAINTIVFVPTRKVVLYNDKTKSFFESNYDQWCKKYAGPPPGSDGRKVQKGKTGEIAGVKAVQYFFQNIEKGKFRVTEEYWAASDTSLPAKVIEAVDKVSNFPPGLGIPLKIFRINEKGGRVTALDTMSCERAAVPVSVFKSPTGYSPVKDPMTLLLGNDSAGMDAELGKMLK